LQRNDRVVSIAGIFAGVPAWDDKRQPRSNIGCMKLFLMILLGIVMVAVVVVMLVGAVGMANLSRDPRTSNKLMRARVVLQAIAIGIVVLLMSMK
jgi:uncharacterized BrkB/YihY/UPF0761 family membrane protein